MPDPLICPNCSAHVEYRDAVGRDLECPHCHAKLMPEKSTTVAGLDQVPAEFRAQVEKALEMAKTAGHSGEISKIQAIKFYRQATGAGLADAKRIIESAGPLHLGPGQMGAGPMVTPRTSGAKSGCWIAVLVMVAVFSVLVGGIVARWPSGKSGNADQQAASAPTAVPPTVPSIPKVLQPPATPQFATMQLEFGSKGVGPAHFDDARSIALDNDGHIYVGEYSNGRVQVFDTTGKYLSEFSLGSRSNLQNLIADRKGMVYAVSLSHILIFKGATGEANSEMENSIDGVTPKLYADACLAGGVMYAISSVPGAEEIIKLDMTSGKIVGSFDTKKAIGESLDFFRIAATTTGEIYALDRQKGVFQFTTEGRYVNRFGGGKSSGVSPMDMPASQLFSPQNIAVDGLGHVYVSDAGSCIKVYDKDGNYLAKFGGNEVAFGIAIDDQDNIYASLRNKHTVRKYVLTKR